MLRSLAPYLHPAAGLAASALALYTASLGLRVRRRARSAAAARRRHRTIGPWLYVLVLANWAGGLSTLGWLRPEIPVAESGHFLVGNLLCALFTAATLLSRRIDLDPHARALHPLFGAAALLISGVQVFLGLQLLP